MRTVRDVERVQRLGRLGMSRREIASLSGIALSTAGKWLRGELPSYAADAESRCPRRGHAVDHRDRLPGGAYAYLLGL